MKIEDQVCSFEQAKKLKGLGVQADTYFTYGSDDESIFDPSPDAEDSPMLSDYKVLQFIPVVYLE